MNNISQVSMALYRIEEKREIAKENNKLPIFTNDELAILELNNEHNKAVEVIVALEQQIKDLKKYCIELGGIFEKTVFIKE